MNNKQNCPVCGVIIEEDGSGFPVKFAEGTPGTRSRLYARVCQYTKDSRCINKDKNILTIVPSDYYSEI